MSSHIATPPIPFIMSFSGGKDCLMALASLKAQGFSPAALFTIMYPDDAGSYWHHLTKSSLSDVAHALGLPIYFLDIIENGRYEEQVESFLATFVAQGISHCGYGDIGSPLSKQTSEERCAHVGLTPLFPLWGMDEEHYIQAFLNAGFKGIVKSVRTELSPTLLGHALNQLFFDTIHPLSTQFGRPLSICGEQGEYHSFIYDGPLFIRPVPFHLGTTFSRDRYTSIEVFTNYDLNISHSTTYCI